MSGALAGTNVDFTANGDADFSTVNDDASRREAAQKGTVILNVWMYVIREFEDAIDDCQSDCIDCNYAAAHAWDEGVAFYTGSLEGQRGISQFGYRTGVFGKLLYALAEELAVAFKVAGVLGTSVSGGAKVNHELFLLFAGGRDWLLDSKCSKVRPIVQVVVKWMTIPLIQGTLRYAYKMGVQSDVSEADKSAGAVFAASILPLVYACSMDAAGVIYENMRIGANATSWPDVKAAIEGNYACLQIACSDVGGIWDASAGTYYDSAGPCGSPYELIAGYLPYSQVTDHNAIDLDQQAMELELADPADFVNATNIYSQGGNSKSYAEFSVPALTYDIPKGAYVSGLTDRRWLVSGKVYKDASAGDTVLKVQYITSDVQRTWVGCRVGGLVETFEAVCFSPAHKLLVAPGLGCPGCGDVSSSHPPASTSPAPGIDVHRVGGSVGCHAKPITCLRSESFSPRRIHRFCALLPRFRQRACERGVA